MLVAAFGHAWLRDQSFGMHVLAELRTGGVEHGVTLADWSFGTIAAFQRLGERSWRRAIFVTGMARGRRPGTLHRFTPAPTLPPAEEIHGRIGDSVMGLVSVDNLVIIGRYYGALPDDVVLVEAEPVDERWGSKPSPRVARLVKPAAALIRRELARPLPEYAPGGRRAQLSPEWP